MLTIQRNGTCLRLYMSVIQIQSLQMSVYCNIAMDFVNIERVEAELCQKNADKESCL